MLAIALPVALSFLGLMFMSFVDLLFVGHVGPQALAAVGLGTSLFSWCFIFGIGLLTGLDYLISHAHGGERVDETFEWLIEGLIIAVFYSIPATAVMFLLSDHLELFGVNESIQPLTSIYLKITALSLSTSLLFTAARLFFQARGKPNFALFVLLGANILNIGLNALLVPRWGVEGSAWATLLARIAMMIAMVGAALRSLRVHETGRGKSLTWNWAPHKLTAQRKKLLKLGLPSGFQMTLEIGVFALATMLASRLAVEEAAAHQIALNVASLSFMVALGVGSATAVLVGQAMGKKDSNEAVAMGWKGLKVGVAWMGMAALILVFFKLPILKVYTQDPKVLEMGGKILLIAAIFQLADGAQTVATGALRGLGDTHSPAIANLFGHWFLGLPVGIYFCFYRSRGLQGLWWGLSVGLIAVAVSLTIRWAWLTRNNLSQFRANKT